MTTQTVVPDYRKPDARGNWITQTIALLVDAYRELNAAKLFWITLILSFLVVGTFAFVGINDKGVTVFGKLMFPGAWNTNFLDPGDLYKFIFSEIAIPWWLGFLASILALISVASVFPNLLTGGSIDLYLAKPIGRFRFFLTKYLLGLLFVGLQVFVFCLASFLVIGVRGNTWEWRLFIAVPLVTTYFSYIFCVCALIGIVTRSTLAAILITLLLWAMLFLVNMADGVLVALSATADQRVEVQDKLIARNQKLIEDNQKLPSEKQSNLSGYQFQLDKQLQDRTEFVDDAAQLRFWANLIYYVKAPLPKTGETVELMSRWLLSPTAFSRAEDEMRQKQEKRRAESRKATSQPRERISAEFNPEDPGVAEKVHGRLTARKAIGILGTSLGFEAFVLAIAAWVFCRRDF